MPRVTVFVYGTLTDPAQVETVLEQPPRTIHNHPRSFSPTYRFVSRGVLEGLHRVDGTYPTLVPGGSVDGRLLELDEAGLELLDAYEGVDSGLYVRISIPLDTASQGEDGTNHDGPSESAWTYIGNPDQLGVETALEWPDGESFERRVQTYLDSREIVIHPGE